MPGFLTLVSRALRRRCPWCGTGALYASWFRMHPRCGHCGRQLEREEEGYRTVAYFLNLVLSEFVLMAVLVSWAVATWPTPPWDTIQIVGAVSMVIAPLALYPVSRALFIAADFHFRPQQRDDVD